METVFRLTVADNRPVRILQISDSHLFAQEQRSLLLGVNTYRSYHAVLSAIQAEACSFDLVVATGDLAQDHSVAAYQHFAKGLLPFKKPCLWLSGNHDCPPAMEQAFVQNGMNPPKRALLGKHWLMVLLDSQVVGAAHGLLSDTQLTELENTLSVYPQRYVLILLHHHPVPSGCAWLDQHGLRNADRLAQILRRYPLANTVVCGHIHQDLDMPWHGMRVLATPSTCVQFKPRSTHFAIDNVAPGWRYLELHSDGVCTTEVRRLEGNKFLPDFDADGY